MSDARAARELVAAARELTAAAFQHWSCWGDIPIGKKFKYKRQGS